jgi:hypothetical protein
MTRLKFEMWPYRDKPDSEVNGYMSRFTDGKGNYTDSWWCSPPASIDHVGPEYLPQRHRHPNVRNDRHIVFIKQKFKEEIVKFKEANPL